MSVKRHDWLKYKEAFFNSEIDELRSFFRSEKFYRSFGEVPQKSFEKRTKGWQEEKQEYKRQLFEGKKEKLAKDPDILYLKEQILKGKSNILKILLNKITKEKDKMSVFEIGKALDLLKREIGEPLVITENKNKNENDTIIELGDDFKAFMKAIKE